MKKISLILVFALLTAILAGCGGNSELESKVSNLQEQLTLLQDRVAALESENAALKSMSSNSAIEAYAPVAEFTFGDWTEDDGILTVTDGFARVYGLTMMDGSIAEIYTCDLVLYWGGMELSKDALILNPGEATDSYEMELDTLRYTLPELAAGDEVELKLEVTLSDGTCLTAWGSSWEFDGNGLSMIAG